MLPWQTLVNLGDSFDLQVQYKKPQGDAPVKTSPDCFGLPLQIRGLARITLAPLTDTLPCLGAVQISLLEEPYIDFSISLFGSLDLMLLPILKDAVNFAANKARCSLCDPGLDRRLMSKVNWL